MAYDARDVSFFNSILLKRVDPVNYIQTTLKKPLEMIYFTTLKVH